MNLRGEGRFGIRDKSGKRAISSGNRCESSCGRVSKKHCGGGESEEFSCEK